jgi:hypothetical protein
VRSAAAPSMASARQLAIVEGCLAQLRGAGGLLSGSRRIAA